MSCVKSLFAADDDAVGNLVAVALDPGKEFGETIAGSIDAGDQSIAQGAAGDTLQYRGVGFGPEVILDPGVDTLRLKGPVSRCLRRWTYMSATPDRVDVSLVALMCRSADSYVAHTGVKSGLFAGNQSPAATEGSEVTA